MNNGIEIRLEPMFGVAYISHLGLPGMVEMVRSGDKFPRHVDEAIARLREKFEAVQMGIDWSETILTGAMCPETQDTGEKYD